STFKENKKHVPVRGHASTEVLLILNKNDTLHFQAFSASVTSISPSPACGPNLASAIQRILCLWRPFDFCLCRLRSWRGAIPHWHIQRVEVCRRLSTIAIFIMSNISFFAFFHLCHSFSFFFVLHRGPEFSSTLSCYISEKCFGKFNLTHSR